MTKQKRLKKEALLFYGNVAKNSWQLYQILNKRRINILLFSKVLLIRLYVSFYCRCNIFTLTCRLHNKFIIPQSARYIKHQIIS